MHTHILQSQKTRILIGDELINEKILKEICQTSCAVILCDKHVESLYGERLSHILKNLSIKTYQLSFEPGEFFKTRKTKEQMEDQMLSLGLGKDTTLLALGGGVTTDLAGFIASTFCRGIPLINIPTSLMAMVDAAIGGKNGVNTPYGKNLIGSLYFPDATIIDFQMLKTLSHKELKNGLVEIIKAALIADASLFEILEKGYEVICAQHLEEVIIRACQIKTQIVEEDPEELLGLRRQLNLGHTVAHAIECYYNYQLTHGEAVAKGIIAECFIATRLNILPQIDFHRITQCLLPYAFQQKLDLFKLIEIMKGDKKSIKGEPRFVMLDKIGLVNSCQGQYCLSVTPSLIQEALKFIQELQ